MHIDCLAHRRCSVHGNYYYYEPKILGQNINDLRIKTWFLLVSPRTGLDTEVDWAKQS